MATTIINEMTNAIQKFIYGFAWLRITYRME
jgi:hypothetical protein